MSHGGESERGQERRERNRREGLRGLLIDVCRPARKRRRASRYLCACVCVVCGGGGGVWAGEFAKSLMFQQKRSLVEEGARVINPRVAPIQ